MKSVPKEYNMWMIYQGIFYMAHVIMLKFDKELKKISDLSFKIIRLL